MSLNCTIFCVCQNLYSVFLFWFLGEMYLQIPAYLFPLACSSTDREQRRKIIKSQPDPSCWKGGAHHTIVRFHRLMFRALLWNHQQLKCHQVPRCSAPKLQPLSSPGIKFLVPAQRNPLHFILSTRMGRMELFPHHHSPLFTNRPPCPLSVIYTELLTSSPSCCCPISQHLMSTGKAALETAALPLRVPCLWWGPQAPVGARLPAPMSILGKEQLLQQN